VSRETGKPENLRVRRTRILLRDALVALIEEQRDFDRITVNQIVDRAMVSRAAFYRNYRDKYQLVEQIFDEAMAELQGTMAGSDEQPVIERLVAFFDHLAAYDKMYRSLLGDRGSAWFADRMRTSLAEMVTPHFPPATDPRPADFVPSMLGAMFTAGISWWLTNDQPLTSQQIATRSAGIAAAVITEANSWTPDEPKSS
jgi:AcrR family transcriptional regulator